jgi:hypothetical protein
VAAGTIGEVLVGGITTVRTGSAGFLVVHKPDLLAGPVVKVRTRGKFGIDELAEEVLQALERDVVFLHKFGV